MCICVYPLLPLSGSRQITREAVRQPATPRACRAAPPHLLPHCKVSATGWRVACGGCEGRGAPRAGCARVSALFRPGATARDPAAALRCARPRRCECRRWGAAAGQASSQPLPPSSQLLSVASFACVCVTCAVCVPVCDVSYAVRVCVCVFILLHPCGIHGACARAFDSAFLSVCRTRPC